jgi:thiol-disulfide isomerase/thioredoxin
MNPTGILALYIKQEQCFDKISFSCLQNMRNSLFQRRQFLLWGWGAAGAGLAASLKPGASKAKSSQILTPSPVPSEPTIAAAPLLPEFQGIQQWLNSAPLTRQDLKGSVVLLQFWTLGCINCQRTLPYIIRWHQQYAQQGLKVIGVHTPEFAFERKVSNIQAAMKRHGITYPVAVDNNFKTWQAYRNEYWPHLFLADRQGIIRYDHIGEGAYQKTAQMIQKLLQS